MIRNSCCVLTVKSKMCATHDWITFDDFVLAVRELKLTLEPVNLGYLRGQFPIFFDVGCDLSRLE